METLFLWNLLENCLINIYILHQKKYFVTLELDFFEIEIFFLINERDGIKINVLSSNWFYSRF